MNDKISVFNMDLELDPHECWKHHVDDPRITYMKPSVDKRATRFNGWYQILESDKSFFQNTLKIIIGRQSKNIHVLNHLTLFTDLNLKSTEIIKSIKLTINMINGSTKLFEFTFDEYIALMNLLNIKKDMFYLPLQYLVFGKQMFHICYENFINFEIILEFESEPNLFSSHVDAICYTLGTNELKKMCITPHAYLVNKYESLTCETNKSILSYNLNYLKPIRSITAYNYSLNDDLCVNLNGMPFYGSYDNTPIFYEHESSLYLFDYLKNIDEKNYLSFTLNTENHMYFKALGVNDDFMNINDYYNKILPTNIPINIESASGSSIGKISFLLQFVVEILMEKTCIYSGCVKKQTNNEISYPFTKISDTRFVEGYWQESHECGCCNPILYPFPAVSNISVNKVFLSNLEYIKKYCKSEYYMGSSTCRLCQLSNGNIEYSFKLNEKTYIFPEGITHYYSVHNVQPSTEFIEAVEQYMAEIK